MKVLYVRERLFESWGKDLFTFGCLFAGWYLNHRYTGGAWAIDFTIAIMVVFGAVGRVTKRYKPQEAVDVLRELVRQENKESQATDAQQRQPKTVSLCVGCRAKDCSQRSEVGGVVTVCAMRQG